ncbi:unnamed protein product [Lymnaea stagnalis]|uniref:Uncharacterized protein n=1 Tax=Lymnaea stagnalis TaxID=6523 RepID=A0AAV2HDD4_LYMST
MGCFINFCTFLVIIFLMAGMWASVLNPFWIHVSYVQGKMEHYEGIFLICKNKKCQKIDAKTEYIVLAHLTLWTTWVGMHTLLIVEFLSLYIPCLRWPKLFSFAYFLAACAFIYILIIYPWKIRTPGKTVFTESSLSYGYYACLLTTILMILASCLCYPLDEDTYPCGS